MAEKNYIMHAPCVKQEKSSDTIYQAVEYV